MKRNKFLPLLLILTVLFATLSPIALAAPQGQTLTPSDETQAPATPESPAPETGAATAAPTFAVPAHTVQAKAALLIELNTNQVLLEQNADEQRYPASLTKIVTCMLALEHGNLSDQITVSQTALDGLDAAGSTADLIAGETLSLEELIYCMMLSSANEACNVIAEYISGSVEAFVELMNQKAQALGCVNTHFVNPHGLHDENHYTTARDISLLMREALKSEQFKTITATATHEVPATNLSKARALVTTNFLISRDTTSNYYYEYATGSKTGFTTPAGRCLVATANNSKLSLLSIVLGAETLILESGDLELQNFTQTKALLEYGFNTFAYAKVLSTLYPVSQIPVKLSAGAETAVLSPDKEITALLPAGFDEAQILTDIKLTSPDGVDAPIAKGQVLGSVSVSYQGQLLGSCNLIAITDIPKSEVAAAGNTTKSFFSANWWKVLIGIFFFLILLYIVVASVNRARRRRYRERKREMQRKRRGDVIEFPRNRHDDRED